MATEATRAAEAGAQPAEAPKPKRRVAARRKTAKRTEKVVFVKSKRKRAVARASVKKGTGLIRVNSFDISIYEPIELRRIMLEPLNISKITQELAKRINIDVNVYGGGNSAQAQAVRGAIAKGIAGFADTDTVRKEYMRYDRSLLVDDPRNVEPKKFKGPKARARFQKSYR